MSLVVEDELKTEILNVLRELVKQQKLTNLILAEALNVNVDPDEDITDADSRPK